MRSIKWIIVAGLLVSAAFLGEVASAEAVFPAPGRAVHIVIPFSAGGATDSMARAVAQQLQSIWGTSVVVDNRPGANSRIGTLEVMRAAPDGYTLLWTVTGIVQIPHLYSPAPWNVSKDFTPVTAPAVGGLVLLVHQSVPGKNLAEVLVYAKENPGKLSYASFGAGSSANLYGDMLARAAGLDLAHVPYKGTADAANDVLSGRVQFFFDSAVTAVQTAKTGKVRIVATATEKRIPQLPDVPTLRELGFPIGLDGFHGVFGPAGMPPAIADKIQRDIATAVATPSVHDLITNNAHQAAAMSRASFEQLLRKQDTEWGAAILASGLKLD